MTQRTFVGGTREGALERALAVLEALARSGRTSNFAEIARRAVVRKPTAHRLLQMLVGGCEMEPIERLGSRRRHG